MNNTTENTESKKSYELRTSNRSSQQGRKGVSQGMERKGNVSLEKAGF